MSAIDRDDVLAVLEERPYQPEELGELLEQPLAAVLEALAAMGLPRCQKCGAAFLRKPAAANKFCTRQCYQAVPLRPRRPDANKGGRRPWIDRGACRAAILAAVAAGPQPTRVIVAASHFSRTAIKDELDALLRAGQLQHLGASRGSKWALASWAPAEPAPPPVAAPARTATVRTPRRARTAKYPTRPVKTREERDAEIAARIDAFWKPAPLPDDPPPSFSPLTRRVEEFEVVWNGTGPLTGPAPGLGSTLSGGQLHVSKR